MDAVKDARKKPPDKALSKLCQEQLDDYRRERGRVKRLRAPKKPVS